MSDEQSEQEVEAMTLLVVEAVTKAKNVMIATAKKGKDEFEVFGIMTLAICNIMADHLRASAMQKDYRVSKVALEMFQETVVEQLEAVSKRVKDRK